MADHLRRFLAEAASVIRDAAAKAGESAGSAFGELQREYHHTYKNKFHKTFHTSRSAWQTLKDRIDKFADEQGRRRPREVVASAYARVKAAVMTNNKLRIGLSVTTVWLTFAGVYHVFRSYIDKTLDTADREHWQRVMGGETIDQTGWSPLQHDTFDRLLRIQAIRGVPTEEAVFCGERYNRLIAALPPHEQLKYVDGQEFVNKIIFHPKALPPVFLGDDTIVREIPQFRRFVSDAEIKDYKVHTLFPRNGQLSGFFCFLLSPLLFIFLLAHAQDLVDYHGYNFVVRHYTLGPDYTPEQFKELTPRQQKDYISLRAAEREDRVLADSKNLVASWNHYRRREEEDLDALEQSDGRYCPHLSTGGHVAETLRAVLPDMPDVVKRRQARERRIAKKRQALGLPHIPTRDAAAPGASCGGGPVAAGEAVAGGRDAPDAGLPFGDGFAAQGAPASTSKSDNSGEISSGGIIIRGPNAGRRLKSVEQRIAEAEYALHLSQSSGGSDGFGGVLPAEDDPYYLRTDLHPQIITNLHVELGLKQQLLEEAELALGGTPLPVYPLQRPPPQQQQQQQPLLRLPLPPVPARQGTAAAAAGAGLRDGRPLLRYDAAPAGYGSGISAADESDSAAAAAGTMGAALAHADTGSAGASAGSAASSYWATQLARNAERQAALEQQMRAVAAEERRGGTFYERARDGFHAAPDAHVRAWAEERQVWGAESAENLRGRPIGGGV
jgi:hypothetical protein